jgi:DNA invertase Pin-like site-specific DNA recombinase
MKSQSKILVQDSVVIYARISKQEQNCDSQVDSLEKYCNTKGWHVAHKFQEQISGAAKLKDRVVLMDAIEYCKKYAIKKIVVWELSRIGRTASDGLHVVDLCKEHGISIYIKQFGIESINTSTAQDQMSKMFFTFWFAFAEMERSQISQRLNRGKEHYIEQGGKVGRKKGQTDKINPLEKHPNVLRALRRGLSIRAAAKVCEVSEMTVQKVKKAMAT